MLHTWHSIRISVYGCISEYNAKYDIKVQHVNIKDVQKNVNKRSVFYKTSCTKLSFGVRSCNAVGSRL